MIRVTEQGQVLYLAERDAARRFPRPAHPDLFNGVTRNFQASIPWIFSEPTRHVPEPRKHLVRHFGWYSHKTWGRRACRSGKPVGG
jgi:hypothetical protein